MGKELAEPDWAPLTEDEVRSVLRHYPVRGADSAVVGWHSPRPMSAAALVSAGGARLFLKRHHVRVRSAAQLRAEHAFAAWLRSNGPVPVPVPGMPVPGTPVPGMPVPRVMSTAVGGTVVRRGSFRYELTEVADGADVYRDAVSWSPYLSTGHAYAAGAALAWLHLAALGCPLPTRPPAVLMNSCAILRATDPAGDADRLVAARPGVAGYLARAGRPWRDEVLPPLVRAAPLARTLPPLWGHGDWHPSNLTWTSDSPDARVAGVFDFGLANRTFAVHDLAIALERGVVGWLDLADTGRAAVDFPAASALLSGYQSVRPLAPAEAAALPVILPVAHLEYAISEIEYFTDVVPSPDNAHLAYEFLVGHPRWFAGADGQEFLRHVTASLS